MTDPATETEKKPRKKSTPTERLDAIGKRAAKAQTNADKGRAKLVKTLHAWGLIPTVSPPETTQELAAIATNALATFFVPAKATRAPRVAATTNDFKSGDAVKLVPDFEGAYATVYTAEERDSMVYDFYDEVSKVAIIKTVDKAMAAKLRHIEKKVVDTAVSVG